MTDKSYEFCKIFLGTSDVELVRSKLIELFGGEFTRRSLFLPGLVIDVLGNPDALPPGDAGDDFVRWPLLVELDAGEKPGERLIVEAARKIISAAWEAGVRAVAACDFEDELPWSGGIARISTAS